MARFVILLLFALSYVLADDGYCVRRRACEMHCGFPYTCQRIAGPRLCYACVRSPISIAISGLLTLITLALIILCCVSCCCAPWDRPVVYEAPIILEPPPPFPPPPPYYGYGPAYYQQQIIV
uniref:Uncharacterized protein n=1 Tax=Romanomermis culicivorax TaxID=13658 RepID=A0A915IDT3_ROMCU